MSATLIPSTCFAVLVSYMIYLDQNCNIIKSTCCNSIELCYNSNPSHIKILIVKILVWVFLKRGPDIRPGLYYRHLIKDIEGYGKLWRAIEWHVNKLPIWWSYSHKYIKNFSYQIDNTYIVIILCFIFSHLWCVFVNQVNV